MVTEAPGLPAGTVLQTVLSLLFILALLFLAAYLLRRFSSARGLAGQGPLKIMGGLMLGTRERIVLVEVGNTWLVIGIGPGQISTLHSMPKGEVPRAD
ncbi:MAG: flagellar biosynthetic protein FliO, partial [Rhodoferax sp.]|nr:flagellar biosynthetic protein FliO [Rhodoferax sp.]